MNRIGSTALALLVAAALAPAPATADEETWQTVSDVGVVTLMVASVGVPLLDGDGTGAWQAVGSLAASSLVTEILKATISRTRPDGSDDHSFPSGHTSRSFAAATTLCVRQGSGLGIPALAVAGLVGVGRVEGNKHYWSDVIAGAAIGAGAGLLITDEPPESADISIQPWLTRDGGGLLATVRF